MIHQSPEWLGIHPFEQIGKYHQIEYIASTDYIQRRVSPEWSNRFSLIWCQELYGVVPSSADRYVGDWFSLTKFDLIHWIWMKLEKPQLGNLDEINKFVKCWWGLKNFGKITFFSSVNHNTTQSIIKQKPKHTINTKHNKTQNTTFK